MKVALIGCGRHMQSTLIPHLLHLPEYEVTVCVDIDEEAAETARRMSHARYRVNAVEEIDMGEIDAALVAMPSDVAGSVTRFLIKNNIACFVEKSPANTSDEIEDLLTLARLRDVYVQIGFNYRYADAIANFYTRTAPYRERPCVATLDFRSKHPSSSEWGIEDPVAAWLYHNGVHMLDLLRWLLGDVEHVHAELVEAAPPGKFLLVVQARHSNGSVSTIRMGNMTGHFDIRLDLFTLEAHQFCMPHLGEVTQSLRDGRVAGDVLYRTPNLDNGRGRAGYGSELRYFAQNFQQSTTTAPSLADALKASQLCDMILQSLDRQNLMKPEMLSHR